MKPISPTVDLARALIRAPSPSGAESPAAEVLLSAFHRFGFDRAWTDEVGNAIGVFERGDGPTVMLNGHLDTVPTGDPALWPHPPLSGEVADGRLWGRGASDMKGSLACMIVAAAEAAQRGFQGTLMVVGVVQEEVGGLGARWLGETMRPDVIVLGEPSKLALKLGHRGRVEVDVHLPGRIAHAAKADLGENALYRAAAFLTELQRTELPSGGPLHGSSATPTRLRSFPKDGANVVPGEAVLTIDYRNLPSDPPDEVLARLQALDAEATLVVTEEHAESESGAVQRTFARTNPAYLAPDDDPWTQRGRAVFREVLPAHGVPFEEGTWWFATDAPYLAAQGTVVLGFGPGEEERAHTTSESVRIDSLEAATGIYRDVAIGLLAAGNGRPA
ncbi:MAG: M20/M25/M40 family metallo-hydrolase [Trueperaceae bacterium]